MNFQEFKQKWQNFNNAGYGFLKLPINHPLEFHVGYCGNSHKALIVMNICKVGNIPCSNAINAESRELSNGLWALELQLMQKEYEEEFLCLGWDIITYSNHSKNPVDDLIRRYLSWQRLLQYAGKNLMSFSRQKGLVGELLFLKTSFESRGIEKSLYAWTGPDGSDQDFVFADTWNEVKSVSLAAESVKISSFEQLCQERDGVLSVFVLEKTTPGNDRIVLPYLVKEIRGQLENQSEIRDLFDMKLFKYGYRIKDENEYEKNCFRFVERIDYSVNCEFPKLTRENIAPEIVSGEYSISLAAINRFRRL